MTGTCGIPLPGVASVVLDIYESDPEGDTAGVPQGRVYRGSLTDNSAADSNPAVGAFTLNTTALGIASGTMLTIAAHYLKTAATASITSVVRSGGTTTLNISGGTGPYSILRASTVTGPYTSIASATTSPAVFAVAADISHYQLFYSGGGGQTSPFATSFLIP